MENRFKETNKKRKECLHPSLFELLLSIPKSIWFNFKVLPFKKAVHLPFLVSWHVKVIGVNRKNFICNFESCRFAQSRIGLSGFEGGYCRKKKGLLYISAGGKIEINGRIGLSRGIILTCKSGKVVFGNNVRLNDGCLLSCESGTISIRDNASFGWDCVIKNCDGHYVISDGQIKKNFGNIVVGEHCWICSHSTILKNVSLGNNCIVAYGSILTKSEPGISGILYAGNPAKPVKQNVDWKE